MKPFIRYFGGKTIANETIKLYEYIIPSRGRDEIYVEPFVGSGGMFFYIKDRCFRKILLNDKDNNLYNLWYQIRYNYQKLIDELKYCLNGELWFNEYKDRQDDLGKAIFYYMQVQTGQFGLINKTYTYKFVNVPFRKQFDEQMKYMDSFSSFIIWNKDFHKIFDNLRKSNSDRVLFSIYCDPPYFNQGMSYSEKFSDQDHVDLANYLNELYDDPHFRLYLSYDVHPKVEKLYSKWNRVKINFQRGSGKNLNSEQYEEYFLSNNPIHKHAFGLNQNFDSFIIKHTP